MSEKKFVDGLQRVMQAARDEKQREAHNEMLRMTKELEAAMRIRSQKGEADFEFRDARIDRYLEKEMVDWSEHRGLKVEFVKGSAIFSWEV